jgi:hypothetical protein
VAERSDAQAVWYVAYASNLARDRFRSYLAGGRPLGGLRENCGCRDRLDPARVVSLGVPGGLVFAGDSTVWGGAMAFFDRTAPGWVACRAYLISSGQFADVIAQEMRRPPGGAFALDLEGLLATVESARTLGSGLYETVVRLGVYEGAPLLTVTYSDVAALAPAAPSAAYLAQIATGLHEAHGWAADRIATYLAPAPGVHGAWTADEIVDVVRATSTAPGPLVTAPFEDLVAGKPPIKSQLARGSTRFGSNRTAFSTRT